MERGPIAHPTCTTRSDRHLHLRYIAVYFNRFICNLNSSCKDSQYVNSKLRLMQGVNRDQKLMPYCLVTISLGSGNEAETHGSTAHHRLPHCCLTSSVLVPRQPMTSLSIDTLMRTKMKYLKARCNISDSMKSNPSGTGLDESALPTIMPHLLPMA